jgi:hypothetical protein
MLTKKECPEREKVSGIITSIVLNIIILISAGILLNVSDFVGPMSDVFSRIYIIPIVILILFFISFQIRAIHDDKAGSSTYLLAILISVIYSVVFTLMILFPGLWRNWINAVAALVFIINSLIPAVLILDNTYELVKKRK